MTFPPPTLRQGEVVGDLGVRQHDDVIPPQPALAPAVVVLDEVAQRIAGFAGLTDRLDLVFVAATFSATHVSTSCHTTPPLISSHAMPAPSMATTKSTS
jgi:hypothetical protein